MVLCLVGIPTVCRDITTLRELNIPLTSMTAFCGKRCWKHYGSGNPNLTGLVFMLVWVANRICINIHSGQYLRIGAPEPRILALLHLLPVKVSRMPYIYVYSTLGI